MDEGKIYTKYSRSLFAVSNLFIEEDYEKNARECDSYHVNFLPSHIDTVQTLCIAGLFSSMIFPGKEP
jgi:hypothetical protein